MAPAAAEVATMTPRGDEAKLFAELHEPLVAKLTSALGATVTWPKKPPR